MKKLSILLLLTAMAGCGDKPDIHQHTIDSLSSKMSEFEMKFFADSVIIAVNDSIMVGCLMSKRTDSDDVVIQLQKEAEVVYQRAMIKLRDHSDSFQYYKGQFQILYKLSKQYTPK